MGQCDSIQFKFKEKRDVENTGMFCNSPMIIVHTSISLPCYTLLYTLVEWVNFHLAWGRGGKGIK